MVISLSRMSDLTDAGARKDAKLMGIYRSIEAQPQAFDDIVARVLGGKFMITAEELLGYVALFRGHEGVWSVLWGVHATHAIYTQKFTIMTC